MNVEIWSDISCPWCYIGRRRFEAALAQFEHRDAVSVTWRSFQLDPNAPRAYPGGINEMVMQHLGVSRERAEALHAQVTGLAAAEGLDYHFERVQPANTFDAHRLIHFAAAHGLQSEMKERLQRAYFTEGQLISDPATLTRLAEEVGLDAEEAARALTDPQTAAAVRADLRKAQRYGVDGVPFFLFEGKYAVSGAQPTALFVQALHQVWQETQGQESPAAESES